MTNENVPHKRKTVAELLETVQKMDARVNNASSRILIVKADVRKLHEAAIITDLTYYLQMEDIRRMHVEIDELRIMIEEQRERIYQIIRDSPS